MKLHSRFNALRRRTLLLFVVVALAAAMLPTAAFASSYGHQGRGWDPGPRQPRGYHRPAKDDDDKHRGGRYNRCDVTYRVKRGDSLSEIAKWYGVSVQQLARANGIKNSNRIYAGQVLCIPC
jgi:nucleoid-associated protein YgaU